MSTRLVLIVGLAACGSPSPKPAPAPSEPLQTMPKTTDGAKDPAMPNLAKPDDPAPVDSTKKLVDESSLTPDMVLAQIQRDYLAKIKRCYTDHLKTAPDARGKVQLSFKVLETGKTSDVAAKGFANAVDTCIAALMPAWQFPPPLDKDNKKTQVAFSIALQLVPD
jgi:hypothetical protein